MFRGVYFVAGVIDCQWYTNPNVPDYTFKKGVWHAHYLYLTQNQLVMKNSKSSSPEIKTPSTLSEMSAAMARLW